MGKKGPTSRGDSERGDQLPYYWLMTLIVSSLSQNQLNKVPVMHEALQSALLLYSAGRCRGKKKNVMA